MAVASSSGSHSRVLPAAASWSVFWTVVQTLRLQERDWVVQFLHEAITAHRSELQGPASRSRTVNCYTKSLWSGSVPQATAIVNVPVYPLPPSLCHLVESAGS